MSNPIGSNEFIHNRSQIGLDYFEFSREHGNVLREIVDYLPRPLKPASRAHPELEVWLAAAEAVDRSQPDSAGE